METIKKPEFDLQRLPRILPADKLCALFSINEGTFRVLMHRCRQKGLPMPKRKRILRKYYYAVDDFALWFWENSEFLKGEYVRNTANEDGDE